MFPKYDDCVKRIDFVPEQKTIFSFEYLRGLAALLVFFRHFSANNSLAGNPTWMWIEGFGNFGVDLFFVLSGFVIASSISQKTHRDVGRFIKGRIRRLVPIYWLLSSVAIVAIPVAIVIGVSFEISTPTVTESVLSFLFLSQAINGNWPILSQGWTLEFEMGFYLMAAIALAFSAPNMLRFKLPILLFLLALTGLIYDLMFFEFAYGIAIFIIYRKFLLTNSRQWQSGLSLTVAGLISLLILKESGTDQRFISFGLPAALIVLGFSFLPNPRSEWLAVHAGRISYPFYLLQELTLPICARLLPLTIGGGGSTRCW